MPLYEYRCLHCRGRYEALLTRASDPAPECPQCGRAEVERLLSSFAVSRPTLGTAPSPPPGPCGSADCACRRS